MQRVDRVLGLALALLALAVIFTARQFPAVPGQKLGAGFLPLIVGASLLVCGLALVWRSRHPTEAEARPPERAGPALVVLAAVLGYVLLADRLGFLLVAPLMLLACLRALGQRWGPALAWGVGGTLVVHLAFYKLLRVPLPWGVLRPFY